MHTEKEWEDIILHEYVAGPPKHTLDILLAELVCILNWYNPFAWAGLIFGPAKFRIYRRISRCWTLGWTERGISTIILKVVGEPWYRLANNFNFFSLKKRIIMMNRMRSARVHLLKLLFLLPLAAVLLAAFRDRYPNLMHGSSGPVYVNAAGIAIISPGRKPLQGVLVPGCG